MAALPGVYDVACWYCKSIEDELCVTASGRVLSMPHNLRFEARRSALRSGREFIVELKNEDFELKLAKGEKFIAVKYLYDAKVSLLRRLYDDSEVSYNQYLDNVQFLGWHEKTVSAV